MKRNQETDRRLDRQLDRLAGQLRDEGIEPERDLWSDIDKEIARTEQTAPRRNRRPAVWRIVAVAASILLLVGVGLVQHGGIPGRAAGLRAFGDPEPTAGQETTLTTADLSETHTDGSGSSLHIVDQAMAELNQALADDPDNAGLSRLVLMIHKSRGNLLRDTARRLIESGG